MEHERLLSWAVEAAVAAGASYCEARFGRQVRQTRSFADGALTASGDEDDAGVGVRVLVDGAWGFAAGQRVDQAALRWLVDSALSTARCSARHQTHRVELAPQQSVVADVALGGPIDPFQAGESDGLSWARDLHAAVTASGQVSSSQVNMDIRREVTELVTSEGTRISQLVDVVGGGYAARLEANGRRVKRSYPHHGGWDYGTGGFEWFQSPRFLEHASRVAAEAVLMSQAPSCPSMETTVVLDQSMVGTLLHETVGHATELDRILGDERDNFGSSFVTLNKLGSYPYGTPIVNVTADSTYPGGAGSYRYDAEGTPAQRVPLIVNGVLVGVTNSRECAQQAGQRSNGTARASSWGRIPMARMTNIILEPGHSRLAEFLSTVDEGIFISTDVVTDIDDNRELCSFGGEIGWMIRHGELTTPILAPHVYTDSHRIWRSCDAIGSADETVVTGILGCGKGQPWQFIHTGQGGPPARFRNVHVGPPRG